MWKALKSLFGISTRHSTSPGTHAPETHEAWVLREGKSVRRDEACDASASRDLPRMLAALNIKTNSIDRHFLLMTIVHETYKRRKDPTMAETCASVAELHISEFPNMTKPLKKDLGGVLPRVTTFQHYATLLTEQQNYDRAVQVCELAIRFGLVDGTKSGYQGRIKRIRKKRKEQSQ